MRNKLMIVLLISILLGVLVFAVITVSGQTVIEIRADVPVVLAIQVRGGVYQNFCIDDCHVIVSWDIEFMEVEYSSWLGATCSYFAWYNGQDLRLLADRRPIRMQGCP